MNKVPDPHLLYMLDTLEVIAQNTPGSKEEFLRDRNAQDATLMRLQDIGEQLVSLRDKFPDYFDEHQSESWIKLIGLRNVISHGYHEIDLEIVWDIVNTKLQPFKTTIETLTKPV